MAATILPQKRVLGESRTGQNISSTPTSTKKRRTDIFSSSPVTRPPGSQNNAFSTLGSSQPKSAFETEVLEKLTQDMMDLKEHNNEKDQNWERPPVSMSDPDTDSLSFQCIEIEEGTLSGDKATVKMFGVTEVGNAVMLHVTDFKHYLYVEAPVGFQPDHCASFQTFLEMKFAKPVISSVSLVERENIYEFQGNVRSPYIKITVTSPRSISTLRGMIEEGEANWEEMWGVDGKPITFDNIQYVLRFMIDRKVGLPGPGDRNGDS